jgi:drug/metabolite transporter (DMT)-like permease
MLGIILSVLSALGFAFGDICKKKLSVDTDIFTISWIPSVFGLIIGAIYFYLIGIPQLGDISEVTQIVFLAVVSSISLILVEVWFLKSIRAGELSLVMPLTAFIPVFGGLLAWISTGEEPTFAALIGILILLIGSWLMFADASDWKHIFRPFTKMFSEPASRYMLEFCLLDAVFMNLMNHGGDRSSPSFFLWLTLIFQVVILSGILLIRRVNPVASVLARPLSSVGLGIGWSVGMMAILQSLTHTMVAYAMAANRVHTIFIVLLSRWILKEHDFQKRLLTSILMVVGVLILILGS